MDFARDSDWKIHLFQPKAILFCYGVPPLMCLNLPRFIGLLHGEFGVKAYPGDHVCVCVCVVAYFGI